MSKLKSPIVTAIASAALTAAVVGGVAIAQTSSSVITACVAENTGNVRIVASASACRPNETSRTWNQQGPQGPAGRDGVDGTDGADGTDGTNGVSGHEIVRYFQPWNPGVQAAQMFMSCPAGKKVLSGGHYAWLVPGEVHVSQNFPTGDSAWTLLLYAPRDWTASDDRQPELRGWIVCAFAS